jgi:hypothetical protein
VRAVHTVDNALRLTRPAAPVRVQNTSNLISWTYNPGDPSTVDIVINNSNNQTLNGNFSIARSVPVSSEVCSALRSLNVLTQSRSPLL